MSDCPSLSDTMYTFYPPLVPIGQRIARQRLDCLSLYTRLPNLPSGKRYHSEPPHLGPGTESFPSRPWGSVFGVEQLGHLSPLSPTKTRFPSLNGRVRRHARQMRLLWVPSSLSTETISSQLALEHRQARSSSYSRSHWYPYLPSSSRYGADPMGARIAPSRRSIGRAPEKAARSNSTTCCCDERLLAARIVSRP